METTYENGNENSINYNVLHINLTMDLTLNGSYAKCWVLLEFFPKICKT